MSKPLKKVYIYLENGIYLEAKSFGADTTVVGEIVFNTSLTGYQEIMSDPSYAVQHLSTNNHLVYQLKELTIRGMSEIVLSSTTARNNLCQLQGVRRLDLDISTRASPEERRRLTELTQGLKNLEE